MIFVPQIPREKLWSIWLTTDFNDGAIKSHDMLIILNNIRLEANESSWAANRKENKSTKLKIHDRVCERRT